MATLRYLIQRSILVVASAIAVSSVVFIGVRQLPGNAFLAEKMSAEATAQLLHHFRLDEPWPQQYLAWLSALIQGDFGESFVNRGQAIGPLLFNEAIVSATLGLFGLLIAVSLGVALGVVAAIKRQTWVDSLAMTISTISYSIPNFVLASMLVLITVTWFHTLSHGQFFYEIGWGRWDQLPVPALALGLPYVGIVARQTRAGMLEVVDLGYVQTARAKGVRERDVVIRHELRNALVPLVSILGPLATGILTGVVVIENIFGVPGLGREFVTSILTRDYNITVAVFTVYALLTGGVNLAVDLLYPVLDPRIRL